MLRTGRSAPHGPPIVIVLAAGLALALLLAWQAVATLRSQQRVIDGVLHDYATLAVDEFARRALVALFRDGTRVLGEVIDAGGTEAAGALPALAESLFDKRGSAVVFAPAQPPAHVTKALAAYLERRDATPGGTGYFQVTDDVRTWIFLFAPVYQSGGIDGYSGLLVDEQVLSQWIRRAFDSGPLIPTLMRDGFENASLHWDLRSPLGHTVLASDRAVPDARTGKVVEKDLGAVYDGVMTDFVLRLAIDPAVAPALIIGGVPRSRLPWIALLFAGTGLLLVTAIVLVRRERALAQMKTDFVSRVSHELRTPLTQIRMYAETLRLKRVRDEAESEHAAAVIDRESRRLTQLVDNVLQFSRRPGPGAISRAAVPLAPLLADITESFRQLHPGARFACDCPADLTAHADADAVRQIVLNLLDNAVRHGGEGVVICACARRQADGVTMRIDDDGPGVPRAERAQVWQPFYRGGGSDAAGTGIGLAVVADLVRAHGGTVSVGDAAAGGSSFSVFLPAAPGEITP